MVTVRGLSEQEVHERVERGEVNSATQQETKTYGQIIMKNTLTGFNVILFVLGLALVLLNEVMNAIAATGIIFVNIVIATFQECRAKRRLDKISLLLRPKVNVLRDGAVVTVDQTSIVKDDIIVLTSGEQALVDGELIEQNYLEMDESLLTGESDTVRKKVGEQIFSGSYCIAGEGYYRVDAFGEDSFASKIMASAKKNISKKTPLQMETQTVTLILMIIALAMSVIDGIMEVILGHSLATIVKSISIIVDIVPIALFLLIVLEYMVAAVRIADKGVLLQEASAVESLSHVDTVCMDKTGTITTNKLKFKAEYSYASDSETIVKQYIGSVGGKNRTIDALENHFGAEKCEVLKEIRFTSARKFSAVHISTPACERRLYLGAPSVLAPYTSNSSEIFTRNKECSSQGLRTVLLAESLEQEDMDSFESLPKLRAVALYSIEDEVRPDCRETIDVFLRNGMDIKVISGDDPATVDALFTIAKIPGERKIISGDELAKMTPEEFDKAALETNIFGRMKPDQKEQVVDSLRAQGKYVAMVGDGVNDVKSLKKAQVGVALESGSGAARGVADMVLVKDDFSALPASLVEGKRTVTGMRDILKIYISRNFAIAIILALSFIWTQTAPFSPVQNMFYSTIATSVSAFFMILWAKPSDNKDLVLPDVLRYTIPTAFCTAISGAIIYISVIEMIKSGNMDPYDGFTTEKVAGAVMVLFLAVTGALQLMVVLPIHRIFSVNGKVVGDIKPFILSLLLVGLAFLIYNFQFALDLMEIPQLTLRTQLTILLMSFFWLILHHYVVKTKRLDFINNYVLRHYRAAFIKQRDKENERALSGEEQKWHM